MRRPFPRSHFGLLGAASLNVTFTFTFTFTLTLTLLATTPSKAQNASGESPSLARYVPKDRLALYLEYEGLDAHADAWQKTAAYKILNDTATGAMLEDLFVQLVAKVPKLGLSGPEALALLKHVARSGFVFAIGGEAGKKDKGYLLLAFRDAYKNKDVRPMFFRFLGTLPAPKTKLQGMVRADHKVVSGKTADGKTFTSWVEDSKKEDIVFVMPAPESADIILETLDGKRPNAVGHPIRAEWVKAGGGFVPTGLAFLDLELYTKGGGKLSPSFKGLKNVNLSWGFQDDALMTVARISTSGPRGGLLALLDGPTFDKGTLPPIPDSVDGFTVLSLDPKSTFDRIVELVKTTRPDAEERVKQALDFVKEKTKLGLKEDILGHLGPKVAWYVVPAKASPTAARPAASMLGTMMAGAGMDQVPRLAIVFDIDDQKAFGRVLDELMTATNHELKGRAARDAADEAPAKRGRNRGAAAPSVEFRLMTGETKMYMLSVPPELSSQFPSTFRPAIRVGPKHVVVAVSADVARMALEAKASWKPPSKLDNAFQGLSSKLKLLTISDPSDTLPDLLAALPAKLQASINTAIMIRSRSPGPPPGPGPGGPGAPPPGGEAAVIAGSAGAGIASPPGSPGSSGGAAAPGANKPQAGPAPIVLQVAAAKLPTADSIKSLLFPSIFTVEVDDQEIRFVSRTAFPSFGDPSKAIGMAGVLPSRMGNLGPPPGGPPLDGPPPGDQPGRPSNRGRRGSRSN